MPKTRLALASGLLTIALTGCRSAEPDPRLQPPEARIMSASSATDGTQEFTGIVVARVQSDLEFRVGGKVVERFVNVGQSVRRGQPLMRLDGADLALAARASAGAVDAARARAIQTGAGERRLRDFVGAGAVSASAYDQARAAADAAQAQLRTAQADARVLRNETGYSVLVADSDGIVVETLAEPGQVVAAGQIAVRVARSGPREASVQLPETERPAVGSMARARTYSGMTGSASLRQLSDSANPASRTFEARYVLSGVAAQVPLGSTVTIALVTPGASSSSEIPLAAIHDAGRRPGVWGVRQGHWTTVARRPVRLSAIGDETATIVAGLRPRDRFVAMDAHMLHQGQAIRIAGAPADAVR